MLIPFLILLPLAASFGVRMAGKKHKTMRGEIVRVSCLIEFLLCVLLFVRSYEGRYETLSLPLVCGLGLSFKADFFRSMYLVVASFMWLMTSLLSEKYFAHYHNRTRYYFFNLLTLTGVMGLFLSDDLYTGFIFFEIMSMASYPWVAHDETPGAMRAAATYLGVAVLGGMVTLMGMFMMYARLGSLSFDAIRAARGNDGLNVAAVLILFGFMAKAGAFPVHIWLPKAHPVAPAPASALLSGMLTKAGMFGILLISLGFFQGSEVFGASLLVIALVTMLLGAAMGLFSNNLKRTLACSSMSQIGYILTGMAASVLLGEEGALPAAGAVTHMINHSVLKLTLFMAAGVVYMNLHKLELNDIRGFGRNKILLHIAFLLGALGLAGVPLLNGYISKTMIHEGLVEYIEEAGSPFLLRFSEWVFLFAAGLTTGYMLKLYVCVFWQKNADAETQARYDGMRKGYLGVRAGVALTLSCLLIPALGAFPNEFLMRAARGSFPFLYQKELSDVAFFSFANLRGGAITLVIGTLAYLLIVRKWMYSAENGYIERWPKGLDLEDAVYRPLFCRFLPAILGGVCAVMDKLTDTFAKGFTLSLGAVCGVLDRMTDALSRAFTFLLTLVCRVLDEGMDFIVIALRETLFFDRRAEKRAVPQTGFARSLRGSIDRAHANLHRRFPRIGLDSREVTDLRYGSSYTNSVTFGLILCTAGIVLALLYAILPALF